MIQVIINGELRQVLPQQSLADLLKDVNIPADRIAIELNSAIVRKRDWEGTLVEPGSQIEIVEFVGGG